MSWCYHFRIVSSKIALSQGKRFSNSILLSQHSAPHIGRRQLTDKMIILYSSGLWTHTWQINSHLLWVCIAPHVRQAVLHGSRAMSNLTFPARRASSAARNFTALEAARRVYRLGVALRCSRSQGWRAGSGGLSPVTRGGYGGDLRGGGPLAGQVSRRY